MPADPSQIEKISVCLCGHHTSISLEKAFAQSLRALAKQQNKSLSHIISDVEAWRAQKNMTGSLSAAVRVYLYYQRSSDTSKVEPV